MSSPKPTDSEQPFINKLWDVFSVYSGFNDIPSPTLQFEEAQKLIQERDQQRLSAALEALPEREYIGSDGLKTLSAIRSDIIDQCQQALTAALGPDNSNDT